MADNVNINVEETNEIINIVASEVQEVIDINVFETAENVTLNITEDIIEVNINKVTAAEQIQSDWNQTDVDALDFIKNKPTIPSAVTNTSDLINDGEDGVNPFITLEDIPPVTGFVPYTGATQDVDLGEFELKAGQVEFDQTPTGAAGVGVMRWNDTDGTLDLGLKGGNVTLQLGQEQVARVVNKTATNITLLESNYQVVKIIGATGQRLSVDLAQANNDLNSTTTLGVVTETIANNQEGFITTGGQVKEINTTGSLQGETWADGDVLYLSPTTAGKITNIKPTAPNHTIIVGYVEYAHAIHGKIFVKVDNGYELEELHNVTSTNYTTPIDADSVLTYDSTNSLWKRLTLANLKTNLKTYFDTIYTTTSAVATQISTALVGYATESFVTSQGYITNVITALGFTPENVANKSTTTSLGTSDTLYPTQNAVKTYVDNQQFFYVHFNGFIQFTQNTVNFYGRPIGPQNVGWYTANANTHLTNIGSSDLVVDGRALAISFPFNCQLEDVEIFLQQANGIRDVKINFIGYTHINGSPSVSNARRCLEISTTTTAAKKISSSDYTISNTTFTKGERITSVVNQVTDNTGVATNWDILLKFKKV